MALGLIFGFLFIAPLVFIYFLIIKGVDRYEPEPFWLLSVAFFWGCMFATFFAIIGNGIGQGAMGILMGGDAKLVDASTATFVAPLVEESSKGMGLLLLWGLSALWLKEIDGALDGAIYGGVIGLGFTLTEDMLYVSSSAAQGGAAAFVVVLIMRTVMGGLGHASFTAMTGLGVGVANETRNPLIKIIAPIGGWMCAVGLHFLHNALLSFLGGAGLILKFMVFWTFDILFFVMLYILVARDRSIVLRGLADEVGKMLHPKEYQRTTDWKMFIPLWNVFSLQKSPQGYGSARRKQLDLVELAFLKNRRSRGESGQSLDDREQKLRTAIATANQQGIFVGEH